MGDTTMTTSFTTAIPVVLTELQQARLDQAKEWTTSFIHHNDIICGGYRFRWDRELTNGSLPTPDILWRWLWIKIPLSHSFSMKWKKDPTNDWSTGTNMDKGPIITMVLYIIDQLSKWTRRLLWLHYSILYSTAGLQLLLFFQLFGLQWCGKQSFDFLHFEKNSWKFQEFEKITTVKTYGLENGLSTR